MKNIRNQLLVGFILFAAVMCGKKYIEYKLYIPIISIIIGTVFYYIPMITPDTLRYKTFASIVGILHFSYEYYKNKDPQNHQEKVLKEKTNHIIVATIIYALLNYNKNPITWSLFGISLYSVVRTSLLTDN